VRGVGGKGWISLTLPAKKLYEIVKRVRRNRRENPKRPERREGLRRQIRLAACRRSRAKTFRRCPEASGRGARFPCHARRSARWSRKHSFAITGEDTRYFLNGALFVLRTDSMSLVATDGHRLALVTVKRRRRGSRRSSRAKK
jgi:DNA polymerase-3 subunit beta